MILVSLIVILLAGGALAWLTGKWSTVIPRILSLAAVLADLIILVIAFGQHHVYDQNTWLLDYQVSWIPRLGINLHLSMDGLSVLMLFLTFFLGILAVLISWKEIEKNVGFFHFNILWILAGIAGVFLATDLFLFYFFWELMLIPMYFLIGIWGHENRIYASYKFFIFTQASGLLMFLSILALYLIHGKNTGTYTFNYQELLGTTMSPAMAIIIMLGFLMAFMVKLPVVPFHNWLPDAHTEAPTAGSLILAGLMLKTGAYGLLRFIVPLFPGAAVTFAPLGMILGVVGILYGAKLAFAQTDLKRLVAYTSVSHMGFIMLGVFAFNTMAYQGVMMQIIAHGISTGALFIMVGQIQERIHTRDVDQMGGLWHQAPAMGAMGLVFAMASLGLPGLGNFIAEFLILAGTFQTSVLMASIASLGLIAVTLYSLKIIQKVFHGDINPALKMKDLTVREVLVLGAMVAAIFYLGLSPQPVIDTARPALTKSLEAKAHYLLQQEKVDNKQNTCLVLDVFEVKQK